MVCSRSSVGVSIVARRWILALVVVLSAAPPGRAQSPFGLDKTRETALLATGAALGIGALVAFYNVDPLTTAEIAALDPNDINDFDRDEIEPYRDHYAADALAYSSYLFPVALLARDDTRRDWQTIGVMWSEATLFNLGLNGLIKATVLRTRPYVYDPATSLDHKTTKKARLSFYSGHTSAAACNSFFTARVLSAFVESSTAKAALWTGAALYPALTGVMRVDSGHHFRSDVITGYVIGAAIGYFVPYFHRDLGERVSLRPTSIDGDPGMRVGVRFGRRSDCAAEHRRSVECAVSFRCD
jgi:membrane-associated phospholipid phosphatase